MNFFERLRASDLNRLFIRRAAFTRALATWPATSPRPTPIALHGGSGRRSRCCCPSEAHSAPRPTPAARTMRRPRRVPPRRHRPEPPETSEAHSGAAGSGYLSGTDFPPSLHLRLSQPLPEASTAAQSRVVQQNRPTAEADRFGAATVESCHSLLMRRLVRRLGRPAEPDENSGT